MPLKIVLADDSMTAQNMGKKILVDAGFEVIAVSNGAAAVKKIAEVKPDIIILDIYMPGYTGLEVCEKVKAAADTANVPVLLTVGKLEPYRPEDGAKAQAEGVIIKPFEASDLLTALGRIAQKYNLKVPQIEPIEIKPREHVELPHDDTYHAWKQEGKPETHEETVRVEPQTVQTPTVPATVQTPTVPAAKAAEPNYEKTMRLSAKDLQAMLSKSEAAKAAAAAGGPVASNSTMTPVVPPAPPVMPPPPVVEDERISTQKLDVPAFAHEEEEPVAARVPEPEPETTSTPMFAIDEPAAEETPAYMMDEPAIEAPRATGAMKFTASSIPDEVPTGSLDINGVHADSMTSAPETTVYPDMGSSGDAVSLDYAANTAPVKPLSSAAAVPHVDPEFEPTAAPKVDHAGETLMELETTHHSETVDVEHVIDPALVTSNDDLMQFAVKFTEAPPAEEAPAEEAVAAEANPDHPPTEELMIPVQETAGEPDDVAAAAQAGEVPAATEGDGSPHSYHDDPLVQMGVISVQPTTEATPDLVKEFDKPVNAEDEPGVLEPASGVIRAMKEFESNTPTDEHPIPAAMEAESVAAIPEVPPMAAPVPEPPAEDESMKKFATELHEAIAFMPNTPHTEPVHEDAAVEPEPPREVYTAPKNLSEEMAAANPSFSDALPAPPEPPKDKVETGHDHELANSLASALENAAMERSSSGSGKTMQISLDSLQVAKAVQKVFDRYKEQMITDIADELGKNE